MNKPIVLKTIDSVNEFLQNIKEDIFLSFDKKIYNNNNQMIAEYDKGQIK